MQSKDNKDEESAYSSPRKRLLEAKQKDAYFEQEVRTYETGVVAKELSKKVVNSAVSAALGSLSFPLALGSLSLDYDSKQEQDKKKDASLGINSVLRSPRK